MSLLEVALAFHDAGYCVVPTRPDGTKAPAAFWAQYQQQRPSREQVTSWFTTGTYDGLGIVCGAVSGHLEMLELEARAVRGNLAVELEDIAVNSGLGPLWEKVRAGYLEATPSGGIHVLYRVDGTAKPNTKLARDETGQVLAETRGEGGYVVVAPSAGRTHPEGKPWVLLRGGPGSVVTLTEDERDALHDLVAVLDRTPEPEPEPEFTAPKAAAAAGGISPGDDYTRATWDELLGTRGWTKAFTRGTVTYWRRPGKNIGVSATTGRNDADRLYVFSTSTDFDAEKPYSKFAAYTLLEHGGDYSLAAKTLRANGYGTPPPEQQRLTVVDDNAGPEPVTYTRTDDGNALRLIDHHRHELRYCPDRGQWLSWTGHRWRWDTAGVVRERARAIARDLPQHTKEDDAHRRRSLGGQALGHMVRIAQTDPRTVVTVDQLDARPYELNSPAGVVDLRTGTLSPPHPDALHTRSTAAAPDLHTTPRRWLDFLADTFAGDPTTTYVQRLLGVSLIGTVLEQLLPFAYGEGANGKTTLLGTVQRLLGTGEDGYSDSAPAELLLATANPGHPTEIARLAGARLVVTSELEDGQRFAEARVKQLTGRDAIAGRFMRQDWFTFKPTHTIWLLANHQPAVRAGGMAFWRRLRLVPFLHTVPPERRDPHLEDRLVDHEGPAILGWIIRGAADYLTHGLAEPDSVRAATNAYERDQDTVARFVADCCETRAIDPQNPQAIDTIMRVKVTDLRAAYDTWCRTEGEHALSPKALTLALRSRYDVQSERTRDARWYTGIRLLEPSHSNDDDSTRWY